MKSEFRNYSHKPCTASLNKSTLAVDNNRRSAPLSVPPVGLASLLYRRNNFVVDRRSTADCSSDCEPAGYDAEP